MYELHIEIFVAIVLTKLNNNVYINAPASGCKARNKVWIEISTEIQK